MGSAFHQLCPRYSGTLTPTAPTAIRLWDTFTFTFTCEWPNKKYVEITFGTFCANSVHKYALHTVFLQLQDRVFSFQENPKNLDSSYKTGASCSKHR